MTTRRRFLASLPGIGLVSLRKKPPEIMTVNGPVESTAINYALSHEHILVDFIGADSVSKARYNRVDVINTALPKLIALKNAGCSAMMECTPAYIGRDVQILRELSVASGLTLITNTGYYGASKEKFFPKHVYTMSEEQLAEIWINEFKNGIDGTSIKPGFMKLGVDNAPLSEAQKKTIRAAALTHLSTGLTIAIHTGNGAAAEEELTILTQHGVAPDALIWVHANGEKDQSYFLRLARKGVWVEFDGVNKQTLLQNMELLQDMKAHALLDKVLVSQDSGWYNVGEPGGGRFNGYTSIFLDFIPLLLKNKFKQTEVSMIFKHNPASAFGIKIKKI